MDSYSGIIIEESRRSEQFSDFTPIPCKGFNILCKAKRYGRWWVLKGLKKPYRQDENYKNLLHKEFDILISLQHPNIVSAYSMEEIPEMGTCIVMEWIDGITLEHWSGRKTEGEDIFLQLLDAVHYIHAKQIVHRDLKPSNIMITHNGNHVKLIDFGLSDTDDFAILKQPAGTPGYISPEQIVSQQADIRNDIFSIGCILEKILPGKPYTAIIKRCKAPITQRYANVDELKADFMARRNSHLSGIKRIAEAAWQVNETTENIGARRLHTVLERLMEDISYDASDLNGQSITIDAEYVSKHLDALVADEDLSRFIL